MNEAEARARLEYMLQWQSTPVLSTAEVTKLLTIARSADASGNLEVSAWAASLRYREGEQRIPTTDNGFVYEVTTAGVAGGVEPSWPLSEGQTVTDGTVVWTNAGAYGYVASWNLNAAAAEGWRWKAAKVVASYDAGVSGLSATRSQIYKHCMEQAARYGGAGTLWFFSPASWVNT